jgi:2-polyprenyl-6-methoxyphenol hydroxylase-like FAD-dependent oxidoreductase
MAFEVLETTCCVVGGGPAGMMLGYLLAREGVHVAVLEKHQDFFRDFRGDTVHPSTLEVLKALGLLKEFSIYLMRRQSRSECSSEIPYSMRSTFDMCQSPANSSH